MERGSTGGTGGEKTALAGVHVPVSQSKWRKNWKTFEGDFQKSYEKPSSLTESLDPGKHSSEVHFSSSDSVNAIKYMCLPFFKLSCFLLLA